MTEFSAGVGAGAGVYLCDPRPRRALAIIMQHIRRHFVATASPVQRAAALPPRATRDYL